MEPKGGAGFGRRRTILLATRRMAKADLWTTPAQLWRKLKPRARAMRHNPTAAEALLWTCLRRGQLAGQRFRRQHAIGPAIVDFYCAEAQLVIEVDGPIHEKQYAEDRTRQEWLEARGLLVLRFPNERVTQQIDGVIAEIGQALSIRGPSPSSPR